MPAWHASDAGGGVALAGDFPACRKHGHGRCAVKLHQHRLGELLPGDSRCLGDLLGCIGGGMADDNVPNVVSDQKIGQFFRGSLKRENSSRLVKRCREGSPASLF